MYKGKTILAIIPARGGSKRLPNKNMLDLNGKPLIAWTIEAAKNSNNLDKVIVTSDSDDILQISKDFGAETIKRPSEFASDEASSFVVIKHALENLEDFDYVILLQPTSPLRNEIHIDEAIELLANKNADSVISICETDHSPLWCNTLPANESMKSFLKEEVLDKRSQELEKYYRLNGAIYISKCKNLLEEKSFHLKENTFAYIMNKKDSIDIDDEFDFKLAEVILSIK
ncbi:acylneuraminate cytidylyltransferase family protein [Candidatus Kapabacteria bacterium]|nr:acylneuraminate cytidylyltransferase family protein [Candidatus Kapabacteria bacterium]